MARRPKYNQDIHDNWAWSLAAMGATDVDIAQYFGVTKMTINRWKKDHPSFADSLRKGKGASDAKVVRSLYERATGYEVKEERRIVETDKDGNIKPVRIETVTKQVPPDVTAQIFWLKNRQRDLWADRPQINEIEDIAWIEGEIKEVNGDGDSSDKPG